MNDKFYIQNTLKLAKKGWGKVSPNPMVGAVVVKDRKIIGKGYHKGPGFPHAEVVALDEAGKGARGATLYVNLEPCCHYGRTPPCTERIIKSKIKTVVASMKDPNPLVNGKGFRQLKSAGINVKTGILQDSAERLNEIYVKYITKKIPFIILKSALTLNGKITFKNEKYLTSDASLKYVHHLRNGVDAILVGMNTVVKDNPLLNIRFVKPVKATKKIILDTHLKLTGEENIFKTEGDVIIASSTTKNKLQNASIWHFTSREDKIPLDELLVKAGEEGIASILVEGGQKIFTSFIKENLVDKYYFFVAPKIGGDELDFIRSKDIMEEFEVSRVKRFDKDIMIEAYNVHRDY